MTSLLLLLQLVSALALDAAAVLVVPLFLFSEASPYS